MWAFPHTLVSSCSFNFLVHLESQRRSLKEHPRRPFCDPTRLGLLPVLLKPPSSPLAVYMLALHAADGARFKIPGELQRFFSSIFRAVYGQLSCKLITINIFFTFLFYFDALFLFGKSGPVEEEPVASERWTVKSTGLPMGLGPGPLTEERALLRTLGGHGRENIY